LEESLFEDFDFDFELDADFEDADFEAEEGFDVVFDAVFDDVFGSDVGGVGIVYGVLLMGQLRPGRRKRQDSTQVSQRLS